MNHEIPTEIADANTLHGISISDITFTVEFEFQALTFRL
jgi:hypothetical protein